MAKSESRTTRDHDQIRRWVEERGGRPATVRGTGAGEEPGILRIDFPGQGEDEQLEPLAWDDFFAKFDDNDLEFLYQDTTADGGQSRFNKFVHETPGRGGEEGGTGGGRTPRTKPRSGSTASRGSKSRASSRGTTKGRAAGSGGAKAGSKKASTAKSGSSRSSASKAGSSRSSSSRASSSRASSARTGGKTGSPRGRAGGGGSRGGGGARSAKPASKKAPRRGSKGR